MLDLYRIEPPEIPPERMAEPSVAGALEYPAALDERAEEVARTYRRLLMPTASIVGCAFVGLVSRGDHAWLVVVPIALYLFTTVHREYCWSLGLCVAGGVLVGRDVIHYLLPLFVASHVAKSFAMHYVWYATGAPVPLQAARRIRRSFSESRLQRRCRPATRRLAYREALVCWFGYNTAKAEGPGVLETPAGEIDRRVLHTCLGLIALCVLACRPFLDMAELMAISARLGGSHLPMTTDQIRAGRTANTLLMMLCVFWVPSALLTSFFKRAYGDVLADAYEARQAALSMPPEERHRAILERLDTAKEEPNDG